MIELAIGMFVIIFLYGLGQLMLDPPYKPIEQERMKMDFLYGIDYILEEEE